MRCECRCANPEPAGFLPTIEVDAVESSLLLLSVVFAAAIGFATGLAVQWRGK